MSCLLKTTTIHAQVPFTIKKCSCPSSKRFHGQRCHFAKRKEFWGWMMAMTAQQREVI
jgi:hypothetical protein